MRARAAAVAEVIIGDCARSAFPSAGGVTPPMRDGCVSFLTSVSAAPQTCCGSGCADVCGSAMQADQRRAEITVVHFPFRGV